MIIQQEPMIQATEEHTNHAITHMEEGNKQVDVANKHARNRRKLKWWCTGIIVVIVLAIALGVGLYYGLNKSTSSGK